MLRHGPMKPMGLTNARNPDVKPYAVVQLRRDNALGTLYNMVGFQTKLKYGAQKDIFQIIPGLENAKFARLGGLHRNTYINSPQLLDPTAQLLTRPGLRFAGQITDCEGYVESAAIGLLTGRFAASERLGQTFSRPPERKSLRNTRPGSGNAASVPFANSGPGMTATTRPTRRLRRSMAAHPMRYAPGVVRLNVMLENAMALRAKGRCASRRWSAGTGNFARPTGSWGRRPRILPLIPVIDEAITCRAVGRNPTARSAKDCLH